jgi:hypothetical protein
MPVQNLTVLSSIGFAEHLQESVGCHPALRTQRLSPSHVQNGFPYVQVPLIQEGACVENAVSTLRMNFRSLNVWAAAFADCTEKRRAQSDVWHTPHRI